MWHDVAERLDIHVVRRSNGDDRVLCDVEICTERRPFRRRELVWARSMPEVENQRALAAVRLILGEVERGNGERSNQIPELIRRRARRVHLTPGTADECLPAHLIHARDATTW